MDVSSSLLVAMMFVMVLSIGLGNILMGLPPLLTQRSLREVDWLPTSWLLLLLLQHLHMFWHTLEILELEDWGFGGFLYVVAGPMLLFLATSLLLANLGHAGTGEARAHYFQVAPKVFSLLAVLMLWMIGVDFVLGAGFTAAGAWNAALLVLFLTLARSQELRLHRIATGVTWALSISLLTSRSFGIA